jgi:hypothetical protein
MGIDPERTSQMKKRIAAAVLVVLWAAPAVSLGQSGRGRGRLAGTVTDERGRPVSASRIVIGFLEKAQPRHRGDDASGVKYTATAETDGRWRFLGLGTGWWRVEVAAEGFEPASVDRFVMQLYDSPPLAVKLIRSDEAKVLAAPVSAGRSAGALDHIKGPDNLIYEQLIVQDEDPDAAALALAFIKLNTGELESADSEFARVFERTQDDPMRRGLAAAALAGRGESLFRKGDLEGARNDLVRSFELHPRSEITAFDLGEICFAARRADEAVFYYGEAARLSPDWSDPLEKLGNAWLHQGDWNRAADAFRRFLALESEGARALMIRDRLKELERIRK